MSPRSWRHLAATLLCGALAWVGHASAAPRPFFVTPVSAHGGEEITVMAFNNREEIVGQYTRVQGGRRAFVLRDGQLTDLGTLGGASSAAHDINNLGQITGVARVALSGSEHAFLYSGGRMRDLGTLGGDRSVATALNDAGQVVGFSTNGDGVEEAFLYSEGRMIGLGSLPGGRAYRANDINASGQVIGEWRDGNGNTHGFLYDDGSLRDLGTLGGSWADPAAINDAGEVVGASVRPWPDEAAHAFLYSGGAMRSVEPVPGVLWSEAVDINNAGDIVGNSAVTDWSGAFLWRAGMAYDINAFTDRRVDALHAINDRGRILGSGCITGTCGPLLLTPVPEPAAGALLLAGLGIVAARAARRSRSGDLHS